LHPYTLKESDAVDILKSMPKTHEKVRFVCIDYNWGPPISGRYDKDFLQLWVAVKSDVDPETVSLEGCFNGDKSWNAYDEFNFVKNVDDHKLYFLQTESDRLPVEFVIKLECTDGSVHYDNNGGYGRNYRLSPYQGRFTSAHAGEDHIHIFPSFVHYSIIKKSNK